jgi:hypothetical protein
MIINKREKHYFPILITLYFLIITILGMMYDEDIPTYYIKILTINFNLFDLLFISAIIYIIKNGFTKIIEEEKNVKILIQIIIIYTLYQLFIILPISYFENEGNLSLINTFRLIVPRLFFLLIPFFYWKVICHFNNFNKFIKLISLTSIILFLYHLSNYLQGIRGLTETGNYRYGWGGGTLLYGFSFIVNLSLFNRKKTNYVLIFISLLGIVFLAHRSGFYAIIYIIILSLSINKKYSKAIYAVIGLAFVVFLLSQLSGIWEDFIARFMSADINSGNLNNRIVGWEYGLELYKNFPINGIMLSSYRYNNALSYDGDFVNIFHNFIMQILVSEGTIGLIFHILILFYITKIALKNLEDLITYQMFFVFNFYLFFALFNVTYNNLITFFFMIIPIAIILYRNKQLKLKYQYGNNSIND